MPELLEIIKCQIPQNETFINYLQGKFSCTKGLENCDWEYRGWGMWYEHYVSPPMAQGDAYILCFELIIKSGMLGFRVVESQKIPGHYRVMLTKENLIQFEEYYTNCMLIQQDCAQISKIELEQDHFSWFTATLISLIKNAVKAVDAFPEVRHIFTEDKLALPFCLGFYKIVVEIGPKNFDADIGFDLEKFKELLVINLKNAFLHEGGSSKANEIEKYTNFLIENVFQFHIVSSTQLDIDLYSIRDNDLIDVPNFICHSSPEIGNFFYDIARNSLFQELKNTAIECINIKCLAVIQDSKDIGGSGGETHDPHFQSLYAPNYFKDERSAKRSKSELPRMEVTAEKLAEEIKICLKQGQELSANIAKICYADYQMGQLKLTPLIKEFSTSADTLLAKIYEFHSKEPNVMQF